MKWEQKFNVIFSIKTSHECHKNHNIKIIIILCGKMGNKTKKIAIVGKIKNIINNNHLH